MMKVNIWNMRRFWKLINDITVQTRKCTRIYRLHLYRVGESNSSYLESQLVKITTSAAREELIDIIIPGRCY